MYIEKLFSFSVAAAILSAAPVSAVEVEGHSAPLGAGTVSTYAKLDESGAPREIGLSFSSAAFDDLPPERNATSRCFDLDGNGQIDSASECEGDYEVSLTLPNELTDNPDIPFTFVMVNWNPEGHQPDAWGPPHFDMHFYQIPSQAVDAMRPGSCGFFMDCDDFATAIAPVPARYVHPEYANVEAAVARMGNHLIDTMTPEFGTPPKPFTHTWIFGAFGGNVIFHEVMATKVFLMLGGDTCAPIKQPQAWEKAGYYPTRYCFRHGFDGRLRVFMSDFVMREAG